MNKYRDFCMAKHGNPLLQKHFGSQSTEDKLRLWVGPFITSKTEEQARRALLHGTHLMAIAAYAFAQPRTNASSGSFVEEFARIIDEHNRLRLLGRAAPDDENPDA